MARVNITVPDEVLARARSAGLNVSRVAAEALREELDRRAAVAELAELLRHLDQELGPVSAEEQHEARLWADGVESAARPGPGAGARRPARPA